MPPEGLTISVFDPTAIEKIHALAGNQGSAFVAEVTQLFLDEGAKSIRELRAAVEQAEWKTVTRVSHSLKSSAAALGLMQLAEACQALELDTKTAAASAETHELAAAVCDQFELTIPILKAFL